MVLITSTNANLLSFLFKEVDQSIILKKQINPYSYLLKFNSPDEELNFCKLCDVKNNTSHTLYLIVIQDIFGAFELDKKNHVFVNQQTQVEVETEPLETAIDIRPTQEQLNELLEKIHLNGYNNLTDYEKGKLKFLSK